MSDASVTNGTQRIESTYDGAMASQEPVSAVRTDTIRAEARAGSGAAFRLGLAVPAAVA